MSNYNAPFEIHVHGEVLLRPDARYEQLQEALKPLWTYAGARSLADGAASAYEEEPGIKFDAKEHVLRMCWTVRGDDDFRQSLDEMCMSLNELSEQGAAIEVTFYDAQFDEDEEDSDAESRDDFVMLFVGPTPAAKRLPCTRDTVVCSPSAWRTTWILLSNTTLLTASALRRWLVFNAVVYWYSALSVRTLCAWGYLRCNSVASAALPCPIRLRT